MLTLDILPPRRTTFPFCELHGRCIVNELPRRCPLRTKHPTRTLEAWKESAWRRIAANSLDFDAGDLRERVEICERCLSGPILTHRRIRRLRERLGVA